MQTSTLTQPRLASAGLTSAAEDGRLVIRSVAPNGNAARVGLRPADVVLTVYGAPVEPTGPFVRPLLRRAAPRFPWLSIRRAGQPFRDHLRRTLLTLPSGVAAHPAILFLPGNGCGTQESPNRTAPEARILPGSTVGDYATLRA